MTITRTRAGARRAGRARRGDAALTPSQLRELEAELRRERARLERSLVGGASRDALADDAAAVGLGGPQAPQTSDAGLGPAVAFESRAHARQAAIVDALDRLERGDYGRCASCGERIPYGRLLVMPEAEHCITCGPGV